MKNSAKKNLAPAPSDEFLTTEEAAKRLKRSVKTLEYWRMAAWGRPSTASNAAFATCSARSWLGGRAAASPPRTPGTETHGAPGSFASSRAMRLRRFFGTVWDEGLNSLTR